jgi:predicted polyphosphate/ATP-dependent NAD kinase
MGRESTCIEEPLARSLAPMISAARSHGLGSDDGGSALTAGRNPDQSSPSAVEVLGNEDLAVVALLEG